MKIGIIGQGYVGKNYADHFEEFGHEVVRYSLEEPHIHNKDIVGKCDMVYIAVPTPTTPKGFDLSIVEDALSLVDKGKKVVIKSTILPGSTEYLRQKNPGLDITYSAEFLREATAREDVDRPRACVDGSTEAELVKYIQNVNGYAQIVLFNLYYEVCMNLGCDWKVVQELLKDVLDDPLYFSTITHKGGRGAGGNCLIKDFSAFRTLCDSPVLAEIEKKNIELLKVSNKSMEILKRVYG